MEAASRVECCRVFVCGVVANATAVKTSVNPEVLVSAVVSDNIAVSVSEEKTTRYINKHI